MSEPPPKLPFTPGQRHVITLAPGVEMAFRFIPPTGPKGFRMGSRGNDPAEEPVHRVVIEGYWLGETPVTQEQFAAWTEAVPNIWSIHERRLPERAKHPQLPVHHGQALQFCAWLAGRRELKWPEGSWLPGLPTEAEWEHACRAGSETEYHNGDGEAALAEVGWYSSNAGGDTHAVDEKQETHPWKLIGMHGNVWEWCYDAWGDDWNKPLPVYRQALDGADDSWAPRRAAGMRVAREVETEGNAAARARWKDLMETSEHCVMRGGAWFYEASVCRSAFRGKWDRSDRTEPTGFRVCLAPGPAAEPKPEQEPAKAEPGPGDGGLGTRLESSGPGAAGPDGGIDLAREPLPERGGRAY